jgi:hypothetical protein
MLKLNTNAKAFLDEGFKILEKLRISITIEITS